VILELPAPVQIKAVFFDSPEHEVSTQGTNDLQLMTIAVSDTENPEWRQIAQDWLGVSSVSPIQLLLQGTLILWTPCRVACVAKPERIENIHKAIIETTWYESELRQIEYEINQDWETLGNDVPLSFEFSEKSIQKRSALLTRYQKTISLRAKLARMIPYILSPVIYPPTLASQINERLRERTRMPDRVEFVESQLEVYERVYESCSQKASDYMLSRSSNILEWYIIILLFIQIILTVVELLSHTRG
jgi:hypothetical protein